MALEDPFFVVKDEVVKSLLKSRDSFSRWRVNGGDGANDNVAHTTELRNALRSIEWDLEDLDDTIHIVEKNPAKFRIDAAELAARKSFIAQTRDEVDKMKAAMTATAEAAGAADAGSCMEAVPLSSPQSSSAFGVTGSTKYSRLDVDSPSRPSAPTSARSDPSTSSPQARSPTDLDERAVMLDEFGTEIENAESKLNATMRKMQRVLVGNDRKQWLTFGVLSSAVLIVMFVLLLV